MTNTQPRLNAAVNLFHATGAQLNVAGKACVNYMIFKLMPTNLKWEWASKYAQKPFSQSYLFIFFSFSLGKIAAIEKVTPWAAFVTYTLPFTHCYINVLGSYPRPSLCVLEFVYTLILTNVTPTILLYLPCILLESFLFLIGTFTCKFYANIHSAFIQNSAFAHQYHDLHPGEGYHHLLPDWSKHTFYLYPSCSPHQLNLITAARMILLKCKSDHV